MCREPKNSVCIECKASPSQTIPCTLATGVCQHQFHFHCISRWLKTRGTCPACNREWEYDQTANQEREKEKEKLKKKR